MLNMANLNGGSALDGNRCAISEYLAFAVMQNMGARLVKTESEIEYYDTNGKKTDMIVAVPDGDTCLLKAVSVTRAMHIRDSKRRVTTCDITRARTLLEKKYFGISESDLNVDSACADNRWCGHIMFIWCEDDIVRELVRAAINDVPCPNNTQVILCTHPEGFADIY